jgi:hypothetical protein
LGTDADADAILGALDQRGVSPMVQIRAAGALVRIGNGRHAEAGKRVLAAGLGARKLELRGLAVEELARAGAAWAADLLKDLRARRKGRELIDAIDDALAQIAKATRVA